MLFALVLDFSLLLLLLFHMFLVLRTHFLIVIRVHVSNGFFYLLLLLLAFLLLLFLSLLLLLPLLFFFLGIIVVFLWLCHLFCFHCCSRLYCLCSIFLYIQTNTQSIHNCFKSPPLHYSGSLNVAVEFVAGSF